MFCCNPASRAQEEAAAVERNALVLRRDGLLVGDLLDITPTLLADLESGVFTQRGISPGEISAEGTRRDSAEEYRRVYFTFEFGRM